MSTRAMLVVAVCGVLGLTSLVHGKEPAGVGPGRTPLVVGTYDSRCLALAYYRANGAAALNKLTRGARARYKKAKAAGDKATMRAIDEEMKEQQRRVHAKGFGTTPIPEVIESIKKSIPQVAKDAGVDLIVCRWDVVFRKPTAKCVDVTLPLVKVIDPRPEATKLARDVLAHPPLTDEQCRKIGRR